MRRAAVSTKDVVDVALGLGSRWHWKPAPSAEEIDTLLVYLQLTYGRGVYRSGVIGASPVGPLCAMRGGSAVPARDADCPVEVDGPAADTLRAQRAVDAVLRYSDPPSRARAVEPRVTIPFYPECAPPTQWMSWPVGTEGGR